MLDELLRDFPLESVCEDFDDIQLACCLFALPKVFNEECLDGFVDASTKGHVNTFLENLFIEDVVTIPLIRARPPVGELGETYDFLSCTYTHMVANLTRAANRCLFIIMKTAILALFLAATTLFAADGVFYVDKSVETHAIAQNGATKTNVLEAGATMAVGAELVELYASERTTIQFPSGPTISADGGSVFTVNTFDLEVKNLTNQPCLAVFGNHNLTIQLTKGNFTINYPTDGDNSSFTVSSPLAMYELKKGNFVFQISDQKSLVYVLDGMMTVHGDKSRKDTAKKGSKSITGQIDTEVATTTRPINQQESSTLATMQTKDSASVYFIVIDGRVRGVRIP